MNLLTLPNGWHGKTTEMEVLAGAGGGDLLIERIEVGQVGPIVGMAEGVAAPRGLVVHMQHYGTRVMIQFRNLEQRKGGRTASDAVEQIRGMVAGDAVMVHVDQHSLQYLRNVVGKLNADGEFLRYVVPAPAGGKHHVIQSRPKRQAAAADDGGTF